MCLYENRDIAKTDIIYIYIHEHTAHLSQHTHTYIRIYSTQHTILLYTNTHTHTNTTSKYDKNIVFMSEPYYAYCATATAIVVVFSIRLLSSTDAHANIGESNFVQPTSYTGIHIYISLIPVGRCENSAFSWHFGDQRFFVRIPA